MYLYLDNYACEIGSLWFQRKRYAGAKVFHSVQTVRGAIEQASTLRFRFKKYIILLENSWRTETSESHRFRRNHLDESFEVKKTSSTIMKNLDKRYIIFLITEI